MVQKDSPGDLEGGLVTRGMTGLDNLNMISENSNYLSL